MDSGDSISGNIDALRRLQSPCVLCPRTCRVSREAGDLGACRAPRRLLVAEAVPHFGEERPLVGTGGSGTVFLAGCNLRCVFCQNAGISHDVSGKPWDVDDLVYAMLRLAGEGCENINFVTPTHYAPQLAEAIAESRRRGLTVPVVYNCGGYESVRALHLLDGLIDIYMPDIKFWSAESGKRYANAADYPDVAREAVLEMHRQVGDLTIVGEVATRGLLVRHLAMPGGTDEGRAILDWLAEAVSPRTYVNVMGQYRPLLRAAEFPEINRRPTEDEIIELKAHAQRLGLRLAE
jgi:putative pyruvate formate lyase activating enzyme